MLVILVALAITPGPATTTTTTSAPVHQGARHARHARTRPASHRSTRRTVTNTPQEAVQRFLEPRSAVDACAQLSRPYLKRFARLYGRPCPAAVKENPRVTHLVMSHVVVNGKNATLKATYRVPAGPGASYFRLTLIKGTWLISGAQ
jgi:hypothetical protein